MAKGGSFERKISKALSLWFSGGKTDDLFWRSAASGARHTVRRKQGKRTTGHDGDISSTDPSSFILTEKISLECKHYKDINIWAAITGAKTSFLAFWEQTCDQAFSVRKHPMLIVRQNNRPILCCVSTGLNRMIRSRSKIEYKLYIQKNDDTIQEMYIYKLDDLFKMNPEAFKIGLTDI